jgi:hypothetical protein
MKNMSEYFELVEEDFYHVEPIAEISSITIDEMKKHYNESEYTGEDSIDFDLDVDCEWILNNEVCEGTVEIEDEYEETHKAEFICKHEKTENGVVYFKILMQ